jgi:hypothetical protein
VTATETTKDCLRRGVQITGANEFHGFVHRAFHIGHHCGN